jgi:phospholipid/cholesterol/gamma-HCH transport system substrate-binding protein
MAEITIRVSDRALRITGIFLGGAVLVWVFFYLWSSHVFVPKYRLRMYVPEVAGMTIGAPVRLDGIEVGTVDKVRLAQVSATPERRIELVLQVENRYQNEIRSDSNATLITEGLLGNRYVSIRRGFGGSPIGPDGEITVVPSDELKLKDVIDSFAKRVACLDQAIQSSTDKSPKPPKKPSSPR